MAAPAPEAQVLYIAKAHLAEGPHWDSRHNALVWVNITEPTVNLLSTDEDGVATNKSFPVNSYVGCAIPSQQNASKIVVALQNGLSELCVETGSVTPLEGVPSVLHDDLKSGDIRFNDGKADPAGRLVVGTMPLSEDQDSGKLFQWCPKTNQVHVMETNLIISNGMVWRGTKMYHIDSPRHAVAEYDYDPVTGFVSNKKIALSFPDEFGYPDGMTIDNEGQLWIAFWGGSCVRRFDLSTGLVTNTIRLPCAHVSSCCWGGAGGKDLFITTARKGLDGATLQSQPLAGSIFVVRGLEPGGPENYRVDK